MKNGFDFEMYETVFKNCFIEYSEYNNGNLQLSLYGIDPKTEQVSHFADITLNPKTVRLEEDEIIVNNRFRPNFVSQLERLGVLKEKVCMCIVNNVFYPIYLINFKKVKENCYYLQELAVA